MNTMKAIVAGQELSPIRHGHRVLILTRSPESEADQTLAA